MRTALIHQSALTGSPLVVDDDSPQSHGTCDTTESPPLDVSYHNSKEEKSRRPARPVIAATTSTAVTRRKSRGRHMSEDKKHHSTPALIGCILLCLQAAVPVVHKGAPSAARAVRSRLAQQRVAAIAPPSHPAEACVDNESCRRGAPPPTATAIPLACTAQRSWMRVGRRVARCRGTAARSRGLCQHVVCQVWPARPVVLPPAPSGTIWEAGSSVEVSWGIRFNHGGGERPRRLLRVARPPLRASPCPDQLCVCVFVCASGCAYLRRLFL